VRLANLRRGDALLPAVVVGDVAYELTLGLNSIAEYERLIGAGPALLFDLAIASGLPDMAESLAQAISRGTLREHSLDDLAAPVTRPGKIVCVGRNYAEHAQELGHDVPTRPILFAKFATAIIGPHDDIVRPADVPDLDYEGELCVVIGRGGRHIPRDRALDHVAGYCCANDVSARTAQLKSGDQWLRGKSYDTFCPLGPALVTRDEVPDPQALRIRTWVDGELRQDASTATMIFDVATLISYCSDAFTLEPGDIILTGTPPGVGMGRTPPAWLEPGQLVEVEISGVGRIANRVISDG
jgi:2-keto-4-pentenoate hydratase/2-oxohepta-3-ene-1,7-dioic acid hydratase in catechol pathway